MITVPILVGTDHHNPVICSRGAVDSDDLSNIEPELGASEEILTILFWPHECGNSFTEINLRRDLEAVSAVI